MILSAHKTPDYVRALNRYSKHDPFACRILSLYHSYRPDLPFVDYWMLTDDDGVFTGAAARNGSCFILFLTDRSDLSEVSAFMRVAGASQVLLNGSPVGQGDGRTKKEAEQAAAHNALEALRQ